MTWINLIRLFLNPMVAFRFARDFYNIFSFLNVYSASYGTIALLSIFQILTANLTLHFKLFLFGLLFKNRSGRLALLYSHREE